MKLGTKRVTCENLISVENSTSRETIPFRKKFNIASASSILIYPKDLPPMRWSDIIDDIA